MASPVSVPNTFTAATDAVAAEVNANFTSLVDYINNNMVHSDGTVNITGTQSVNNLTVTGTLTGDLTGNITGNAAGSSGSCTGNAATATKWASEVTLTVDGDMTGSVVFDGATAAETLTLTAALEAADIPNLSANKITSDTLGVARIPDLAASKITTGTFGSGDYTFPGNLDVNGIVKVDDGSASAPSFTFDSEENTGIFRNTATQFSLVANGGTGLIVASTTVNTAGPTTSSTSGHNPVYRNNTFGTLVNFTSRAEVKENIVNVSASDAGAWIDALQPVTFNERWLQEGDEPADNKAWREADSQVGFIADDVFANPTTARFATIKDENGTLKPVSWRIENVLAAAVAEIKSLRARMEAVEAA
jgi:hypothetical protein